MKSVEFGVPFVHLPDWLQFSVSVPLAKDHEDVVDAVAPALKARPMIKAEAEIFFKAIFFITVGGVIVFNFIFGVNYA